MLDYGSHPGAGTKGDKIFKGLMLANFAVCGGLWVYMVYHMITH
jgi:hypothetical protein